MCVTKDADGGRGAFQPRPHTSNSTKISYSKRSPETPPSPSLSDVGRTPEMEEQLQLRDLLFLFILFIVCM